jgi:two-component system OmpR family sensor kinase
VTAFFVSTLYIEHSKQLQKLEKRYVRTSLFLLKQFRQNYHQRHQLDLSDDTVKLYLQESNFQRIDNDEKVARIQKHAKLVKKRKVLRARLKILRRKKQRYLLLKHRRFTLLLKDKKIHEPPFVLLFGYVGSLLFLLGLYFWLIRSLKPLKSLQEKIQEVAEGDLTVSFKSSNTDEIAQVSNAFDDALRKLESLIDSRQLFLRAIMHELKTPIGKGKILNAFLEEDKLIEGYDEVFGRLELLLNEFAKIEQMLSANYEVKMQKYNAQDLIEQSLELMILDEVTEHEKISVVEKSPLVLSTDFSLFPLALKNLIDNAMKYSQDGKVEIVIDDESISVLSKGVQFTDDIKSYFTPFHAKGEGLGLGLYIVHNSLEMLKLKLDYGYMNGKNRFKIIV